MNRDKELNDLVNRLNRMFPYLEMMNEGHYLYNESDYSPPIKLDWYDIINELDKNGIEIKQKLK